MMGQDFQDWIRKVVIPVSFRSLTDTPGSFDGAAKKAVIVNDTETALVYSNINLHDHSARHEDGAADEISVAGLSGVLADKQDPQDHGSRHESGGGDEIQIANLPDYSETTVELGGDFDAGQEVKCVKNGNMVCITSLGRLDHSENYFVESLSGAIPSAYRPADDVSNVYFVNGSIISGVAIKPDGTLALRYYDWDGAGYLTTISYGFSITYNL